MTRSRQWMSVGAIVVALAGALWWGASYFGSEFAQVTVGSPAPPFSAVTPDSVPVTRTLADYAGQVTLLNVWATWCVPCEKEMPLLQQLYDEYRGRGFRLAAVSIDSPGTAESIREFADKHGLTFDILHDPDGRITLDYMTSGVPETFVIGKDGVIRYRQIAAIKDADATQIRALVDQLLGERAN